MIARHLLIAALGFACAPALAADIGTTYPAGSITTRLQAQDALAAARAAEAQAETAQHDALQRCAGVFLQNQCTQDARRKFDAQKREIRRVEIEAREVQRRIDAEQRAAKRKESEANKADGTPAPIEETKDRAATQEDKDKAAAANRERYQKRQKAHEMEQAQHKEQEAAESGERAANVKAYEEKQRDAAAYAKRKEEERIANEKRREDRRIERERKQKELEDQAKQ